MIKANKTRIVVSGINLIKGGPFMILLDCLNELSMNFREFEIIAVVNNKQNIHIEGIEFIEIPGAMKSYLYRLFYEYIYFKKLSKKLNPFLWISLNDFSPNINAKKRAVYCHNPALFYKGKWIEYFYEPSLFIFKLFYRFVHEINIRKNNYVIVQQGWLRNEFINRYGIKNVLVAHPNIVIPDSSNEVNSTLKTDYTFIYPALGRVFKNFEVIAEAVKIIEQTNDLNYKVLFTIDGTENRYSKFIKKKYGQLNKIFFIGLKDRDEIFEFYNQSDCLLFASKLETWGLPLSEYKSFKKPILVSDLPYAYETIGKYNSICFFDPNSAADLATLMVRAIKGDRSIFSSNNKVLPEPDATNWNELIDILIHK